MVTSGKALKLLLLDGKRERNKKGVGSFDRSQEVERGRKSRN